VSSSTVGGGRGKVLRSLEEVDDTLALKALLLRVELVDELVIRLSPRELASALIEEETVVAIKNEVIDQSIRLRG
jgi:hypothetical protein